LQKNLGEEHIKREVFVSQVSKVLQESDLIRKAHNAILRFIESKDMEWDCDDNNLESIQEHFANCGYDEDTEIVNNDGESNNVNSFLPVRAIFKVNLWPKVTEEIVICRLAEKSVRNRRQMNPIVLRFLNHQFNDKLFWEKVLLRSALNTKEMELSFGLIPIITHSASGMIGLC